MVHSCFEHCKPKVYSKYDAKAFTVDKRDPCPDETKTKTILGHKI